MRPIVIPMTIQPSGISYPSTSTVLSAVCGNVPNAAREQECLPVCVVPPARSRYWVCSVGMGGGAGGGRLCSEVYHVSGLSVYNLRIELNSSGWTRTKKLLNNH